MNKVINRSISKVIDAQRGKFPVLALTGPRQSGKTTLLKELFPDYEYISLENPDNRAFAIEDPNGFLNRYSDRIILDEVQRTPELFSYIQTKVDESKKMGQFILSGSQNFNLLNNINQSLAGRVALFKLFPLDIQELENGGIIVNDFQESMVKGFYPAIYDRKIDPNIFYSNYIQTYVERDITSLINIRDLNTFRTFLKLCAGRAGQMLNLNSLANQSNISHPTAKAWLSILESSFITFQLAPYYENFNKRLVKSPKLYFYDTGLLSYLLGIRTQAGIDKNRLKGNIFENMIVAELFKQNYHNNLQKDLYFWQDSNGNEVDLLIKEPNSFYLYEVKSTQTIRPELFKKMTYFEKLATTEKIKVDKMLIYAGNENQKRTNYTVSSWKDIILDTAPSY